MISVVPMKSYILLLLTCGSVLFAQPARDRLVENNSRSPVNGVQLADSSTAWNPSDEPSAERKDVTAAVVYSLLLPGMGELYAGNYGIGKYFTIVEGALWVTLIGFDRYANWIQNDAREFATEHAGISIAGKDNQYFVEIGNYINVQAYNAQALRDRDPLSLYNEQSSYAWSWDSPANLQLYSNMRINSDQWFDNTHFVVAADRGEPLGERHQRRAACDLI